jgi:hypothetical protein
MEAVAEDGFDHGKIFHTSRLSFQQGSSLPLSVRLRVSMECLPIEDVGQFGQIGERAVTIAQDRFDHR